MRSGVDSSVAVFTIFRTLLGAYLFVFFVSLIPFGTELFSREGMLPEASLNPSHGYFPNILAVLDTPRAVSGVLCLLSLLSVGLSVGVARRPIALLVWYGWVCLAHRNNLTHNPSLPYIAWLLLACALIPPGEGMLVTGFRVHERTVQPGWRVPGVIRLGAWLTLGTGYFASGADKLLTSRSWRNGDALGFILDGSLAREGLLNALLRELPPTLLAIGGALVLAVELSFGVLAIWGVTRPWAWLAMTVVQLGILLTVDITELTLGMLLVHLFVFDGAWGRGLFGLRKTDDLQRIHSG